MSVNEHETEIRSVIANLWPSFQGGDGEWTRVTFEALRDLGSRLGYESLYSARCGGPGEWLWDFLWYKRDPLSGHIETVPLVAESEWGSATLRRDFEKLLVANAPLRLIILQGATEDQVKAEITAFRSYCLSFQGPPALYLAACWVYDSNAPHPYFESWAT